MVIGIIGAMEEEVVWIRESMRMDGQEIYAGMVFSKGTIHGRQVIVVMSGIGKVNAALCAQILFTKFDADMIINTGLAGALDEGLEIGDIVISEDLMEHDFDARSFGYALGEIPRMDSSVFKADPKLVELAKSVLEKKGRIRLGRILSGDVFVADAERKKQLSEAFHGLCVEMEGAAIAHVCHVNKKPFVIIRTVSDKADNSANHNFNEFIKIHAIDSGRAVVDLIERLELD